MKKCCDCKQIKPLSEFHRATSRRDGRGQNCKDCQRARNRAFQLRPHRRLYRYVHSAKVRGLEFTLTPEQFMQFFDANCFYCGTLIEGIGLDRRDNSIGYVASNCIPCCKYCNYMKRDMSESEFIARCKAIAAKV